MSVFLNIIGILLLLFVAIMMLVNPLYGTVLATLMLMGDFEITVFDYDFIAKLFVLLCAVLSIMKRGIYKRAEWRPLILLMVLFAISLYTLLCGNNSSYSFTDFITSFSNILVGVLAFSINWDEYERQRAFRLMAWAPIVLIILGVIRYQTLFYDGRIVTVGLFSQVPFWCGMGYMAAITLSKVYGEDKYTTLALADLAIILFTDSRGGAIFAAILVVPYATDIARNMTRRVFARLTLLIPIALYFISEAIGNLLERTFSGGMLNTTNRLEAWNTLLELSEEHRIIGMGIGSLKTITGNYIIEQGFTAAHNEYVRFIYETGVIGLFIFVWIMAIVFKTYYRNNIFTNKKYIIAPIIGFIVYSFTDNTVSAAQFWMPFMLVASLQMDFLGTFWEYLKSANLNKKWIIKRG